MRLPLCLTIRQGAVFFHWFNRNKIVALELGVEGQLGVKHLNGEFVNFTVCADSFVHSWLIVLRYASSKRIESIVLPAFMTSPDDHRRLRVWLKTLARKDRG